LKRNKEEVSSIQGWIARSLKVVGKNCFLSRSKRTEPEKTFEKGVSTLLSMIVGCSNASQGTVQEELRSLS
jgi:hypothetical protein